LQHKKTQKDIIAKKDSHDGGAVNNNVEKIVEVLLFCKIITNFARKSVRERAAPQQFKRA
jgi:hypothetical protein